MTKFLSKAMSIFDIGYFLDLVWGRGDPASESIFFVDGLNVIFALGYLLVLIISYFFINISCLFDGLIFIGFSYTIERSLLAAVSSHKLDLRIGLTMLDPSTILGYKACVIDGLLPSCFSLIFESCVINLLGEFFLSWDFGFLGDLDVLLIYIFVGFRLNSMMFRVCCLYFSSTYSRGFSSKSISRT